MNQTNNDALALGAEGFPPVSERARRYNDLMSYPAYPPVPGDAPPLPARQPSRRKNLLLIFAVVLLLLLLLGAGCVALFIGGSKSVKGAQVTADQFLTDVEKRNYKAAHTLLSTKTGSDATPETVSDVMAVLQKRRGKATGHTGPDGWNVDSRGGVTRVRLVYKEKFAGGSSTPVQLILTSEDGGWKVTSFNFSL